MKEQVVWTEGRASAKALRQEHTCVLNRQQGSRRRWLTPVILTTQEAEIRRIEVQSQPRQILLKTLS
jgi:hypothetical protein